MNSFNPHAVQAEFAALLVEADAAIRRRDYNAALELLTRRGVIGFGMEFQDGASLTLRYQNRFERIDDATRIGGTNGVDVPAGRYTTSDASIDEARAR